MTETLLAALVISLHFVRLVLAQQLWVDQLGQQVAGPLYSRQAGDNTSRLVYGHAVDPFDQEEDTSPSVVLVAQGVDINANSF